MVQVIKGWPGQNIACLDAYSLRYYLITSVILSPSIVSRTEAKACRCKITYIYKNIHNVTYYNTVIYGNSNAMMDGDYNNDKSNAISAEENEMRNTK